VAIDALVSGVVMLFAVAPTVPGAEGAVADEPLPEPLPDEPLPEELPPEEPVAVFEPLPAVEPLLDDVLAELEDASAAELVPPLPPQADNVSTTAIAAIVRHCQTLLALTTLLPRAYP
jgi:hypothetical protein